jgi:putative flippase GtrA
MSPASRHVQLFKFLAAGLPSFILAVPLNYLLAGILHIPKAPAYAVVLVFQITINFFMCRWFVFEKESATPLWKDFYVFTVGIAFFRLCDWLLYSFLVNTCGFYFLAVQLANVVIFSVAKFLFSERALR